MDIVETIIELFETRGHAAYVGEPVSQKEHALQAAWMAEQSGAEASAIAAALLHDIGHLVHGLPEDIADHGIDGAHEAAGEAWLARYFGPAVTEPVRLHVAAKRFLCATEPGYQDRLSPASVQSLALQGGPMNAAEVDAFRANPYYETAIRLRHWDDEAKIVGLQVPETAHYRPVLSAVVKRGERIS